MSDLIRHILDKYDIHDGVVHPVQKGYRNQSWHVTLGSGREINVIIYKSEPGILDKIKHAGGISSFLAGKDFPVRHTIDDRIMRLQGETMTKYAALYNYLPGSTIPWEAYSQKHIKLLGKTLSDMHAALRSCHNANLPNVTDEYERILDRMERYFNDPPVAQAMASKLSLQVSPKTIPFLRKTLAAACTLSHTQPLHMDFVRSNVLFEGVGDDLTISGILDFEKTALGSPLFDIARTLAFLLVDCKYKSEAKVRKYFLYSGYHKRGASNLSNTKLLDPLVDLFLIYDFYKFLRHNPYEDLGANEHYLRTRDILVHKGLLMRALVGVSPRRDQKE